MRASSNGHEFIVKCYVDPRQSFYYLSRVHAGLLELQRRGRIRLRLTFSKPVDGLTDDPPWTPWLEVSNRRTGETRTAVIDLGDWSKVFALDALKNCDVYFKRNLFEPDLEHVPDTLRARVQPFGFNYACLARRQKRKILSRVVPGLLYVTLRSPNREYPSFKKRLLHLRQFLKSPPIESYEQSPHHSVDPIVFFHARVWPKPSYTDRDVEEETNRPRAELVRALKKEFKNRFLGGLAPNEHARRHYPDLISDYSGRRDEYIAAMRRALVAVASPHCVRTSSFKLAEYLAASRCIVCPPYPHRLPAPLIDGVNYLGFRTVDECIERCARLLEDRGMAEEMRLKNWQYYQTHVAPAQHMENLLSRVFEASASSQPGVRPPDSGIVQYFAGSQPERSRTSVGKESISVR
ncbi:MAG: glycosyltransferase family 1 protein [Candidatus Latescibacterota bacterium]|nr:MAG: glycosyltransferase family 1 protein [Candidatus Latescibacterota bacterium]